MKLRSPILFLLSLLLLSHSGAVTAQDDGPVPQGPQAPGAEVGTGFTYQGRLTGGSAPVNGTCDMEFKLFSAATGGTQIGSTVAMPVTLVDGLFTVALDFGATAFAGQERWLEIAVKCGSESSFTVLTPRQALTAAPYALSLRPGATISGASDQSLVLTNSAGRGMWVSSGTDGVYVFYASDDGVEALAADYGVFARGGTAGVYASNTDSDFAADLVLGATSGSSDNGNLYSDPAYVGSDIIVRSNDEIHLYLDNNGDENGSFQIFAGGGTPEQVFRVDEIGDVYADGGYHCGNGVNDDNASGDLSEPELNPCLSDGSPADFAEMLPASGELVPGDVLVIGRDGQLTRSTQAYQPNVAGVYSTRPSYLGNARQWGRANYAPLAVVGVVPVKVSAENGAIEPGDLLTTASLPGHAMKASPLTLDGITFYPSGVLIGKALEALESGTGVIQVLLVLH